MTTRFPLIEIEPVMYLGVGTVAVALGEGAMVGLTVCDPLWGVELGRAVGLVEVGEIQG